MLEKYDRLSFRAAGVDCELVPLNRGEEPHVHTVPEALNHDYIRKVIHFIRTNRENCI